MSRCFFDNPKPNVFYRPLRSVLILRSLSYVLYRPLRNGQMLRSLPYVLYRPLRNDQICCSQLYVFDRPIRNVRFRYTLHAHAFFRHNYDDPILGNLRDRDFFHLLYNG